MCLPYEKTETIVKKQLKFAASASGALLLAALLGPASPALAESGIPCVGTNLCTDTFDVTGAPEFWTVPNGVDSIQLYVAAGSGGGAFASDSGGGAGGAVSGWVDVTPGEELALIVGDRGQSNVDGGAAGFGGGGDGDSAGEGAGGGGGSFVFISSGGGWEPLLVAGGGGGALAGAGGAHWAGAGGFSDDNPDAAPENIWHAAGATTTAAGYAGGNAASFDGSAFTPGRGQHADDAGALGGGGGGGYFGGGAGPSGPVGPTMGGGGGGSGFASSRVDSPTGGENLGPGQIVVRYSNFTLSEAALSVQPGDPVVGKPVTLMGIVTQFDLPGDEGTLTFTASLAGEQKFSRSLPVTIGSGAGPFTGSVETTFVPEVAGEYTFSLVFTSGSFEHLDAVAADVMRQVGDAPPVPPEEEPDELAETGTGDSGAAALGALGALLLGAGAILCAHRRRQGA